MSRRKAHPRRPAEIFAHHELWGPTIYNENLGWRAVGQLTGLNQRASITLVDIVRAEGPLPARSGLRKILVVGDAHAKPRQDLSRFSWLGRMVIDVDPDVVVCIGDWADCHAHGRHDRGKRKFEGARLLGDIEAGNEALRLFHREIDDFNADAAAAHVINPRLVFCVGNHEHRIATYVEERPELEGLISINDFDFEKRGWEMIPFLDWFNTDGIAFSHYYQTNSGRAKAGIHLANNVMKGGSVVVGHSHGLDSKLYVDRGRGVAMQGLVCGLYSTEWEDYAGQSNDRWWRGICVLEDVADGGYDLRTYSLDRIERTWGER